MGTCTAKGRKAYTNMQMCVCLAALSRAQGVKLVRTLLQYVLDTPVQIPWIPGHPLARSINHEVSAHGACKSWSVRVWCVAVRCCQEGLNGRGRRARFTWNPCFWQGIVAPHKKAKDQAGSRNVGKMGIHPCPLGPYSRLLRPGGFPLHCM